MLNAPEGREVVPADQLLGGPVHGFDIERFVEFVDGAPAERPMRSRPDAVAILPPRRSATRIEVERYPRQRPDRDVRRQQCPDRLTELRRGHPADPGESDHLAGGMDPGIRPTGHVESDGGLTRQVGQHALQLSLDGPTTRLRLEAGELRAVIFDPCAVPHGAALSGVLHLVRRSLTLTRPVGRLG